MHFSDEELDDLEEMALMLEEMSEEEIDDFVQMIEILGKAKKTGNYISDNSNYLQ